MPATLEDHARSLKHPIVRLLLGMGLVFDPEVSDERWVVVVHVQPPVLVAFNVAKGYWGIFTDQHAATATDHVGAAKTVEDFLKLAEGSPLEPLLRLRKLELLTTQPRP